MVRSRQFECNRQVPAPPSRPSQVEPFLPPTRAICQPLWGKTRAEREECLSVSLPLPGSRPLCRKTKFTTDAAGSLSGQEVAISRRGRFLPGTFRLNLVDGHLGSWLSARRPFPVLPRSLHGKLLLANWWRDFTTSYASSGLDPRTIASPCQSDQAAPLVSWTAPATGCPRNHEPTQLSGDTVARRQVPIHQLGPSTLGC